MFFPYRHFCENNEHLRNNWLIQWQYYGRLYRAFLIVISQFLVRVPTKSQNAVSALSPICYRTPTVFFLFFFSFSHLKIRIFGEPCYQRFNVYVLCWNSPKLHSTNVQLRLQFISLCFSFCISFYLNSFVDNLYPFV